MLVTICKRLLARSVAGTAKKITRKQANCVELHPFATHVMLECYESDYRLWFTLSFYEYLLFYQVRIPTSSSSLYTGGSDKITHVRQKLLTQRFANVWLSQLNLWELITSNGRCFINCKRWTGMLLVWKQAEPCWALKVYDVCELFAQWLFGDCRRPSKRQRETNTSVLHHHCCWSRMQVRVSTVHAESCCLVSAWMAYIVLQMH